MTMKLAKILVAVDFSECSMRALKTAIDLGGACGATVDILNVWELPSYLPPTTLVGGDMSMQIPLLETVKAHAAEELERFATQAENEGLKIGKSSSAEGTPWRIIVEVAEREGYDLIALGTMGRTGLMHALLGSVAEKVVRHSKVPVLTVKLPDATEK